MKYTLKLKDKNIPDIHIADTFYKRLRGFMFQRTPKYNAIVIKPCNSIHTFFMHFPIDVLFLNNNMEVIRKIENLPPRKVVRKVKGATLVIEGWGNIFKDCDIGDKIKVYQTGVPKK